MKERVIFPIPEAEVYKIVKKAVNTLFKGSPNKEQFDDLVQNSMVRLVDVFNLYDPQKGSFSNFVYMQVNWAIWRDNVHYSAKGRRRDFMVESLDYVIKDNDPEGETLIDFVVDNSQVKQTEHELNLQEVMQYFGDHDRYLIREVLINGKSIKAIAEEENKNYRKLIRYILKLKTKVKEVLHENIL